MGYGRWHGPKLVHVVLLLVVLAASASAHSTDSPSWLVPKPSADDTDAIALIGTDTSQLTAVHIRDALVLRPQAARTFLQRLRAASKATGTSATAWQAAELYAHALPAYLHQHPHLQGTLQLMRQLASGAATPFEAAEKLQIAATQLNPHAFTAWARKMQLPIIRHPSNKPSHSAVSQPRASGILQSASKSIPTRPSHSPHATTVLKFKARSLQQTPQPAPAKPGATPYKIILDPFVQYADWRKRLISLGGSANFLTKLRPLPTPKPTNPSLNAGISTFRARKIGLIFHMMLFPDSKGYLYPPQAYWNGAEPAQRMVNMVNHMFRYSGTNLQFYVKAYHSDVRKYPYLKFKSLLDWQSCGLKAQRCTCALAKARNIAPDRYINIFVIGSTSYYMSTTIITPFTTTSYTAATPGSFDTCLGTKSPWHAKLSPPSQHIWLLWDQIDPLAANSDFSHNSGAVTLAHELGHALGLLNTYNEKKICNDGDLVVDTPAEFRDPYADLSDLGQLCNDMATIPLRRDDISWYDSCRKQPQVDNVFNIMGYAPPNCKFYFTRGQVCRMQETLMRHLQGYGK